ncbi:PfkB family carbohydrate kinase, partial [Nocardiopsis tropica]|nr:PfkB family carbohydrate kinase [Nocardiopsis tropica]
MILTLTPNPSVDHTLEVERLIRGEVLRVSATRAQAGGKGVNVARALRVAGVPTRAVLPVGGGGG